MVAGPQMKTLKRMKVATLALSFIGIGLCAYSVYVSYRKEANKEYKALCDIDEHMSCSKVFTSEYGKGFGFLGKILGNDSPAVVSNGIYGMVFYCLVALLSQFSSLAAAHVQRFIVLLTNVMSVYLAYILYFVLKDLCVVCIATYAINFLLTICCFVRVNCLLSSKSKKKASNKSAANKKEADAKSQGANKKQKNKSNPNSPQPTKNTKTNQNSTKPAQNAKKDQASNGQIANKNQNSNKNAKNQNQSKSNQNSPKNQNQNQNQNQTKNNQNSNKSSKKKNN